jgi:hypothetical protein
MAANISFAQRAKHRIHQSVKHCVGIGMARKSAVVRNLNAAQHEFSPAAKPMRVKPVPDANFRRHLLDLVLRHHHPKATNNQQGSIR